MSTSPLPVSIRARRVLSGRQRRAVPAGGWALPLVVFLLSAGVIAMHSLGATHHPPITSAMASAPTHSMHSMNSTSAPMPTQVVPGWVSGSALSPEHAAASGCAVCAAVTGAAVTGAAVTGAAVSGAAVSGDLVSAVDGAKMRGHGLMAMCLAVLPFLALLLRRTWRGWLRISPAQLRAPGSPSADGGQRWRAGGEVSLTRLCILRT